MPQSVEIPGQGLAEFPDEMSPDEIKGVIQTKFYGQPPAGVNPSPTPAGYDPLTPGSGEASQLSPLEPQAKAEPLPSPPGAEKGGSSFRERLGQVLGAAKNIGVEALSDISPEMSAQVFGSTEAGLRPEEKSKPLISPELAKEIVGTLPEYAGGNTAFGHGVAEAGAGALSEFSKPSAIAELPAFAVPGFAETFAANTGAELPKQVRALSDTFKEHGILSKESGAAITAAGIQDALGILAGKEGTAGRFRAAEGELAKAREALSPSAAAEIAPSLRQTEPVAAAEAPVAEAAPAPVAAPEAPTAPIHERLASAQRDLTSAQASGDATALAEANSRIEALAQEMMAPFKARDEAAAKTVANPEINPNREVTDQTIFDASDTEMAKKAVESVGWKYDGLDSEGGFQVTNPDPKTGDTMTVKPGETLSDLKDAIQRKADERTAVAQREGLSNAPAQESTTPVTPETAIKEVKKVVDENKPIGSPRDPADVKAEIIQRIEHELQKVSDEAANTLEPVPDTQDSYSVTSPTGERIGYVDVQQKGSGKFEASWRFRGETEKVIGATREEALAKAKAAQSTATGNVTIDIPGDGTFTVVRDGKALTDLLQRANRLQTGKSEIKAKAPVKSAPGASSPSEFYAQQLHETLGKNEAIADQQEQLSQVKKGSPAAKMIQDTIDHLQRWPGEEKSPDNEPVGVLAATGGLPLGPQPVQTATRTIKSQRQIITDLAEGLKVPIRFGRLLTNKFAGYFMPKSDLIGSKKANHLTVVTHEVGHKLDKEFQFRKDPTIRAELNILGDPQTPGSMSSWTKSKSKDYKYGEGVAEFVRHWLIDPAKAANDAPMMHAAFEKMLNSNKDVGDVMRQAQSDIQVWRNAEPQARLRSHISIGDNPNGTRYTLSQLTRDLVDDLHYTKLFVEDAKAKGASIPPSKDVYMLARNLRGSYGMADTVVRHGMTDFRTRAVDLGTSLEDALRPLGGRIDDFIDWIVAKRAQELHAQGKETGLVPSDVAAVAQRFENDTQFQEAFQKIKEWNAGLLKYAVDSGLVTPESATKMLEMNQDYVPFHRVFEVGAGESSSQQSLGTGSGLNAGKPSSLKSAHGSPRQIVDPIEAMVKNAYALVTASEKAAIANAMGEMAGREGMGKWIERVAAPKEHIQVALEKVKKQLEDAGADVNNVPDDLLLSFYRQSGRAAFGENTIRVVRNGKPEFYRLNSDLFDTFHALDMEDSGKLIRILAAPAQLLRSGVVLEPSFSVANALRDTFSSAVIGKYGALPFETTIRGVAAMIKDPKLVAEWAASGGQSAIEANYFDRSKLQNFIAEKITKDLSPSEKALVVLKSPLAALRHLTGLSEEATRIGEYQTAMKELLKSGMPEGEARRLAAFEARDRQDFAKGGAKTKMIRSITPFWNAGLQANVKLIQTLKDRPVRTMLQGLAYITMPKLLEQALNYNDPDYWDRPQWERDLFFMIPAGKDANGHTRFIRVPTPFEVGVMFGTLPGRIVQYAKQHNPDALTGYFNTLLQQSVPNPIPTPVQAMFENFLTGQQGWDVYRGRPIVPDSLAKEPPEFQYTEQTSRLAKTIGKTFNLSPMKIDHIIAQSTGGLGKVVAGQEVPGKRFVTTPLAASNQSTQNFYDQLGQLHADKKRFQAGTIPAFSDSKLSAFEKAAREMSQLRSDARKSQDDAEKNGLRERIYEIARDALQNN